MADEPLARLVHDLVERMREPLGLDRWTIKVDTGAKEDPGSCIAQPEYRQALLEFDLDKLETGDELDEIVAHEMTHCHTAPIHDLALELAECVAGVAPEHLQTALRKKFNEEVRLAAEDATTQVGFTYIRLLRRLWKAETELTAARAEIKSLRKQIP